MSDLDTLRTGTHNGHLMVAALKRHRTKPVMHLGDTVLTGGETAARISQYIQAFESLGAGRGTAGALLALNRPEVLFILGAGQTQGFQRTSLHPLGSLDDHAYVINDAEISVLVVDPVFADRAAGLLEKCPGLKQVLTIGPVPDQLAHVGKDLVATAAEFEPKPLEAVLLPPDHITSITYTGGTTGKPKGVIGLAQSFSTMTAVQLSEWEWPTNPKFLMCTPLSHAGAAFFAPTVIKGGELHVLTKFDPAEVLRVIEEEKITATMLVPSMLYALMDPPDSRTRDLSSLETVYYGASAINPVRLKEAIERFGPIFAQYYGQSEAPMVITYLSKEDHAEAVATGNDARLSSCGRPAAMLRTALSGGYWKLPEVTAETFRDGWMHTGDVAREDEDGFWYIVDRTKDMIVTGGFNVFPGEVDEVLAAHPAVDEVAVAGVPSEEWGEEVVAFVVVVDGADCPSLEQLREFARERLADHKLPRRVVPIAVLPRNALGKVLRHELREAVGDD